MRRYRRSQTAAWRHHELNCSTEPFSRRLIVDEACRFVRKLARSDSVKGGRNGPPTRKRGQVMTRLVRSLRGSEGFTIIEGAIVLGVVNAVALLVKMVH